MLDAGAAEVHFRIASPPTVWPCFYGVDTPERDKLLAATMTEDEMRAHSASTRCASSRSTASTAPSARQAAATRRQPQYCDACFSGDYPVRALRHGRARLRNPRAGVIPGPETIALVTGASRGFGYAAAAALGAAGAQVIAMARTVGGLEDLADAIEAAGGPTPTLAPLSITDDGGMQRLCLAIHDRWGRLDLVIHAAAHAAPLAPTQQLAAKDFDASVEVNLRGTRRLIAMTAPLLAAAPAGVFVQVADDRAGAAYFGSYGATKGAADALARSWAAKPRASARASRCSAPSRCPPRCAAGSSPARPRRGSRPAPSRRAGCWRNSPPDRRAAGARRRRAASRREPRKRPTGLTDPSGRPADILTQVQFKHSVLTGRHEGCDMSGNVSLAVNEKNIAETAGSVSVSFVRSGDLSQAVTVLYQIQQDGAMAGADYVGRDGSVTIPAGRGRPTIEHPDLNDTLLEPTEDFIVAVLSRSSGTLNAPRTTRVNILDDERPVVDPDRAAAESDYDVSEVTRFNVSAPDRHRLRARPGQHHVRRLARRQHPRVRHRGRTPPDLSTFGRGRPRAAGLQSIEIHPNFPEQTLRLRLLLGRSAGNRVGDRQRRVDGARQPLHVAGAHRGGSGPGSAPPFPTAR